MTTNVDANTINSALEKMCKHHLFANSTIYTRLLRYLVKKAIQNEDVKELSIGTDLFYKNYVSDKNDGAVRIHMYKLRKKLVEYYTETTGQHDVIFQIEKGQYNLHFISQKEFNQQQRSDSIQVPIKYVKVGAWVSALVIIALIGIHAIQSQKPEPWKSFFKRNASNMLVVSDQMVLMHINEYNERRATIYSEINNPDDFLDYKKNHSDRRLETTDYTLLSKMAPYGTKHLSEWFLKNGSSLDLQLESDLSLEDIKENNVVFIGQRSAMNISSSLFLKNSKTFSRYKDGYRYKSGTIEKSYNTKYSPSGKVEYAMVSYGSISPGKKAIYFVSNHDIGVIATLRNFTDKDWLKEFYQKLPSKNQYFNALFEVSGIKRTDVSCKLVELEIIEE